MTDQIRKQIELRAPLERVWRAISDKTEFGKWFGIVFPAGTFTPGETDRGKVTYPGYEHLTMDLEIVEVIPEKSLVYRWHPYAMDANVDYSSEPMTNVTFTLEPTATGTLLTVVESGFDAIPLHRRAEAFRANEGGWKSQLVNIERYVSA